MIIKVRIELTEDLDDAERTVVERDISIIYHEAVPDMLVALRAAMFAAWGRDYPEAWDCERCLERDAARKAERESLGREPDVP